MYNNKGGVPFPLRAPPPIFFAGAAHCCITSTAVCCSPHYRVWVWRDSSHLLAGRQLPAWSHVANPRASQSLNSCQAVKVWDFCLSRGVIFWYFCSVFLPRVDLWGRTGSSFQGICPIFLYVVVCATDRFLLKDRLGLFSPYVAGNLRVSYQS